VLNRKNSIQAYGRFFSSKIDITEFTDFEKSTNENTSFYPDGRAKAKTMAFGMKYRIFTGDGLSPVGKYLSFGAEYASNKFDFKDTKFLTYDRFNKTIYNEPINEAVSTLILTFGFGTQYPLGKSIMFNLGGEAGLPFSLLWSNPFGDGGYAEPPSEDWVKVNSKNHFFRSYIFNITVGLALIP
jgi:hypothetical protein